MKKRTIPAQSSAANRAQGHSERAGSFRSSMEFSQTFWYTRAADPARDGSNFGPPAAADKPPAGRGNKKGLRRGGLVSLGGGAVQRGRTRTRPPVRSPVVVVPVVVRTWIGILSRRCEVVV